MPGSHDEAELSALNAHLLGLTPGTPPDQEARVEALREAVTHLKAQAAELRASQQVLSIGRIVQYRLERGPHKGELRPAIVVRIWGPEMANLQVFTDGYNDGLPCPYWATSVHAGGGEREWRWPTESTGADPGAAAVHIPVTSAVVGGGDALNPPPESPDYPRVPNHHPFA